MENKTYTVAEIPAEVLAEIKEYYPTVITDNYGTIDDNTRTRKCEHKVHIEDRHNVQMMCLETFEPVEHQTVAIMECYAVRAVFDDETKTADLRSVFSMQLATSKLT